MKLKKKYRILEKRYSDGGVGFFPQRGDWWHGWRYFADNSFRRGWDEPCPWLSYDTYEEAEKWLRRPIWSPGFVLLILVMEAFAFGIVVGSVLRHL